MSEFIEQKLLQAVKNQRLPTLLEWKVTLFALKQAEEALKLFENVDGEECRYDGSAAFVMSLDSWNEISDANGEALATIAALGKDEMVSGKGE